MIKIRVMQADGFDDPLSYNMSIAIKNEKNLEILDTQFKFSNLENKKLIYTHTKEEPLMVCITSDVEVYSIIQIDVMLEMSELSPVTSDFYQMENAINKARQLYADFNTKINDLDQLERNAIDENIKVNSKVIRTSFLQMIILLIMGILQFGILRFAIKRIKKE